MKALTKAMLEERGVLVQELHDAFARLERKVERFNGVMQAAWGPVEVAMEQYNAVVDKANDWKGCIAGEIQTYMDERSDKWRESERGQAYQEWLSEYAYADLETADLDIPDLLTLEDGDQSALLEGLSEDVPA